MKHYLVGGAVRNRLLGLPVNERDWLTVGASREQLIELGYQPVGREFGLFLHPETKEEHALPRGAPSSDEHIQVARDLRLRDLTVNAIAIAPQGEIFDPLNGRADLERRILRHTPGFSQDPLRVLRLARFVARFAGLGFRVADETLSLVRGMAQQGLLNNLTPERCWREIEQALAGDRPSLFFRALHSMDTLQPIMPELDRLFGVPQPVENHPEIDAGEHSMLVLDQACLLSSDTDVRLAALLHDLGKGTTPPAEWPGHTGHEQRGAKLAEQLCRRLRIPSRHRQLTVLTAALHGDFHHAFDLKPATLLQKLKRIDALRRPERLQKMLLACTADLRGRPGYESCHYPQAEYLLRVLDWIRNLRVTPPQGLTGEALGRFIDRERQRAIETLKQDYLST